jgi:hypothetical protein
MTYINDIGDVSKDRIIEAICATRGYQDKIPNIESKMPLMDLIPNPETKEEFASRMVENDIISQVKNYETELIKTDSVKDYDVNVVSEKLNQIMEAKNATGTIGKNERPAIG